MRRMSPRLMTVLLATIAIGAIGAVEPDYVFDQTISHPVLERFLSRAVTHAGLLASSADPTTACLDDDIRMLSDIGAKFVGRAAFAWDLPRDEEAHFAQAKAAAAKVHAADPQIILQACVFEIVCAEVDKIPVPSWVFAAFGAPPENRAFNYGAMLYDNAKFHNHWRPGASVPDMSKLETRLWFYYRACRYIDCGVEAIHFGQVKLMDDADPGHRQWIDLLTRVRDYARKHARRKLVLCDAHTHGETADGKLLFDFHSYPMRLRQVNDKPQQAVLGNDSPDDLIGRSKGGMTPSGWTCESLPYLVEFDNYGYSGHGGRNVGGIWVWGYDEISWFAHQSEDYRNHWLRYAFDWMAKNAPNGHLQMPTRRLIAAPTPGNVWMFSANAPSAACPTGFNVEATIKAIWQTAASR